MTKPAMSSTNNDFSTSPYRLNNVLRIKKHIPPTSLGSIYEYLSREESEQEALTAERDLPLEERCRRHPPLETKPLDTKELSLKIIKHLRVGKTKPAQLILPEIPEIKGFSKDRIVAKFYDPYYYDHEDDELEPFLMADHAYSREAEAYQYLKDCQGSIIPRYYGSYSCELPMSTGTRPVRLILIEYIQGICMDSIDPKTLSRTARQNIMEKLVRAESYLYARKFCHRDHLPRNVMIRSDGPTNFEDRNFDVILIDLESSKLGWKVEQPGFDEAISPIIRWHRYGYNDNDFMVLGWIDWEWQEWLERCFKDDPTFKPITAEQRRCWGFRKRTCERQCS